MLLIGVSAGFEISIPVWTLGVPLYEGINRQPKCEEVVVYDKGFIYPYCEYVDFGNKVIEYITSY